MKRKKRICLGIILIIFCFKAKQVYAKETNLEYLKTLNREYVIDKYDIDMKVNEDNTFDITEKINVYFNVFKHGIYRTIPLKNTIIRNDGTTSTKKAQIINVSVDNEYTTSMENGNYKIKIGSPKKRIINEKSYTIKYTYNIGKDPMKGYDELYYNLIGNDWDTVIGNVSFKIEMPKDFDISKLGFTKGRKGSVDTSGIHYTVNNNIITGTYDGILNSGEGLTVRCELEEGYFQGAGYKLYIEHIEPLDLLIILIPILCFSISLLIWYKYGRDLKVVETVEFYPPEGLNSLEVGFLYKGKAESQDVISLLIYLANLGYIKIEESDEKMATNLAALLSTKKGFKFIKLKEYDGNNQYEKLFFKGLFRKGKMGKIGKEVTARNLYDNFYQTMNKILGKINNKENKEKIFEKTKIVQTIIIILMLLSFSTIIWSIEELQSYLLLVVFYLPFFAVGIFTSMPLIVRIIWLGFILIHSLFMFPTVSIIENLRSNPITLFSVIIGFVCMIGMIICFKCMPKRTPYGNEMLGKIKGFKTFLETAEKEKLEAMVMENPSYFYHILPYTYALGVSDKWVKKFESISLQAPSWYDSTTTFDTASFGSFMKSTMENAESVMSSSPYSGTDSSSSGGISDGGGSSGGGSGGGGGGSW